MHHLTPYQDQFIDYIIDPKMSEQPSRFTIYYNNWLFGLIKALIHTYSVCERLTGKRFFEAMANQYVKSHFSSFFSLNSYGFDFFEFIKNFAPASPLPYLSDVAKLEWLIHKTLIGTPNSDINLIKTQELINKIDEHQNLKLSIVENGNLITSEYPIHKIWETNQDNHIGETIVNLDEGRVWLLVWRKELELRIDELENVEWKLLVKIQEKEILVNLLESEVIDQKFLSLTIKTLLKLIKKGYINLTE